MTDKIIPKEIEEIISQLEIAVQLADLEEKSQSLTLTLFGKDYPITVEESDRPRIRCFKCNKMTANFVVRFLNRGKVEAKLCRKCAIHQDELIRKSDVDQELYFKGKE